MDREELAIDTGVAAAPTQLQRLRIAVANDTTFFALNGFAAAGFVYPVLVLILLAPFAPAMPTTLVEIFTLVCVTIFASVVCGFAAVALGVVSIFVVSTINRSLGFVITIAAESCTAASVVAWFSFLPMAISGFGGNWLPFALGPLLANIIGQFCAAHWCYQELRAQVFWHARRAEVDRDELLAFVTKRAEQFSIQAILMLTFWIAGAFAIARGVQVMDSDVIWFLGAWAVVSPVTTWLALAAARQTSSRWPSRRKKRAEKRAEDPTD